MAGKPTFPAGIVVLILALTAACRLQEDERDAPLSNPDFLILIQKAQESGVTPYWLGESFSVAGVNFQLSVEAELQSPGQSSPGVELTYGGLLTNGVVTFDVASFKRGGGGSEFYRDQANSVPGTQIEQVEVGSWQGDLYSIPLEPRPVNQQWLFLEVGDMIVIGQAISGENGIPGSDPNPLIEKNLLISAMSDLRPYPE